MLKLYFQKFPLMIVAIFATVTAVADNAQFTATDVCEGSQTLFTSNSTASGGATIIETNWDFDNDSIFDEATGESANHMFDTAGTYIVGIQIINDNNDTTEAFQEVVINPIADADYTVNEVCQGDANTFIDASTIESGEIMQSWWDFNNDGDYSDASGDTVQHTFATYGTFTVGHKVVSDSGCTSIVNKTVLVHPNPTVDFTFDEVCLGDSTELSGTASVATGTIASHSWELNGDNQFNDASGTDIMHEFINAGNYNVGFRATTNKGCSTDTFKVVTIAPIPYINFNFEGECNNVPVEFTNLSFSPVGTMDYTWDFGDDSTSTETSPTHLFVNAGVYDVQLTGESSYGCSDSTTQSIEIFGTPMADFTFENVCFGETVHFENESKPLGATIESYYWDFGDGGESVETNPSHDYLQPDSFDVTLVVYSTEGCRDTLTQWVHVWELPQAHIDASGPLEFCIGNEVTLSVDPDSTENVLWSNASDQNSITVDESGEYNVLLYDEHNCKDRDTVEVTVYPLPTITTSNDTSISIGFDVPLEADGGQFYEWTPADYLDNPNIYNPTATPLQTTTYTVTVEDEFGCVNTDSVTITVVSDYEFVTYNLFSPNADGVNDFFEIKNIQYYEDCEVVVYNRLGTPVFESKNYQNDWDGTFKDDPLPEATYYFVVKCEGTEKMYKGPITILR